MNRRGFLTGLGALVTLPFAAEAQPTRKAPRIGFLSATPPSGSPALEAFRQGLRELGYVEGQNITVDYRSDWSPPSVMVVDDAREVDGS
ncbi:MAG: hypothetical protein ACREM3_11485 [Candidatus Rokuibacteriota bacterium]